MYGRIAQKNYNCPKSLFSGIFHMLGATVPNCPQLFTKQKNPGTPILQRFPGNKKERETGIEADGVLKTQ